MNLRAEILVHWNWDNKLLTSQLETSTSLGVLFQLGAETFNNKTWNIYHPNWAILLPDTFHILVGIVQTEGSVDGGALWHELDGTPGVCRDVADTEHVLRQGGLSLLGMHSNSNIYYNIG